MGPCSAGRMVVDLLHQLQKLIEKRARQHIVSTGLAKSSIGAIETDEHVQDRMQ